MSFDRYANFRQGNKIGVVPFGEIPETNSDIYITYMRGTKRLDQISYEYYGSPDYAWLILQANPQYGSMEFNIPDNVELRIPYPLNIALEGYNKSIEKYNKLY
jgi:hypothetical protein